MQHSAAGVEEPVAQLYRVYQLYQVAVPLSGWKHGEMQGLAKTAVLSYFQGIPNVFRCLFCHPAVLPSELHLDLRTR